MSRANSKVTRPEQNQRAWIQPTLRQRGSKKWLFSWWWRFVLSIVLVRSLYQLQWNGQMHFVLHITQLEWFCECMCVHCFRFRSPLCVDVFFFFCFIRTTESFSLWFCVCFNVGNSVWWPKFGCFHGSINFSRFSTRSILSFFGQKVSLTASISVTLTDNN